jgi:hypothetical protein
MNIPFLMIQLKNMFIANRSRLIMSGVGVVVIWLLTISCALQHLSRAQGLRCLSFFSILSALILSSSYNVLAESRQPFNEYLQALPISNYQSFKIDYLIIVMIYMAVSIPMYFVDCSAIAVIIAAPVIFIGVAYLPITSMKRHGYVAAIAIAVAFLLFENYLMS